MIYTKKCVKCGEIKDENDFTKRSEFSFRNECKSCICKLRKKHYEIRKSLEKCEVTHKTCIHCKETKNRDEFRKHPSNKDGMDAVCKECMSEYYKSDVMKAYLLRKKLSGRQKEIVNRYRISHAEQIKERKRDTRTSFAHSIQIAESRMRSELRTKVHQIIGGKCVICGEERTERLCIDHINDDGSKERLSQAGSFRTIALKIVNGEKWDEKYQLLCFNCNKQKQLNRLRSIDKNNKPEIKETKTCTQCSRVLPIGMFAESKGKLRGKSYCKDCGCVYNQKRKKFCIDKLGGKCTICGETRIDILELDHINNDGAEKRKLGQDSQIILKIYSGKRDVGGLQILCANCNAARYYWSIKEKVGVVPTKRQPKPKEVIDFSIKNLVISQIPQKTARDFLNEHHYAGCGRSGKVYYGAFLDSQTVAVAKFAPVVRKEVATSMGLSHQSVIELDRFCINPVFQKKNAASFILSKVVKMLPKIFSEVTHIVSFADTAQGHRGTIYAACGWKKIGVTSKSYHYIGKSGNVINKKTLYGRAIRQGMTEREYAAFYEYEKIETPEKIKFALQVNNLQ